MIGQRNTKARENIIKYLKKINRPVTAHEIYSSIGKTGEKINLTSIYRNINLMKKKNLVHSIILNDKVERFELLENKPHHHHIICNQCGRIDDIEMKENEIETKVKNKTCFKIKSHILEFFGLCPNCQ
ncbi:hypothetical protein B6D29_03825 [Microgenomates bacterium UTCPR1]|nr:transcriptional repressor [Patescibacteria group bacterium]OQY65463.1 MAG: hypothetical protein B6D29_03825 [Microgenomates bacterium UTCPR1]